MRSSKTRLQVEGRELLRALTQDHLDLRAAQETRLEQVVGADGVSRAHAETGRTRGLATVFGPVTVRRTTYRQAGHASLHPADGILNLPAESTLTDCGAWPPGTVPGVPLLMPPRPSPGVSGQRLGNRQVEELTGRAAVDFDQFYAQRPRHLSSAGDVLVLSYQLGEQLRGVRVGVEKGHSLLLAQPAATTDFPDRMRSCYVQSCPANVHRLQLAVVYPWSGKQ